MSDCQNVESAGILHEIRLLGYGPMTDDAERSMSQSKQLDAPVPALKTWVTPKVITGTSVEGDTAVAAGPGSDADASAS